MELPNVAAITMVRDEGVMLPRWVAHYGSQLGYENLVVVDDNSADGSTRDLPCPVIRIPPVQVAPFEPVRMRILSDLASSLLGAFDAVVFSDVDEFIIPDPQIHAGLREFIAARPAKDVMGVMGLNVIHHVGVEPALEPDRPILGQRRLAKLVPIMCKPAVKRIPARWPWSTHGIQAPFAPDRELYMFHMKFADREHLARVGDHRLRLAEEHDRGTRGGSWTSGGDNLVALLDSVSRDVDLASVPEYVPKARFLAGIVKEQRPGFFRAKGRRQVSAMEHARMVRVPDRFLGLV